MLGHKTKNPDIPSWPLYQLFNVEFDFAHEHSQIRQSENNHRDVKGWGGEQKATFLHLACVSGEGVEGGGGQKTFKNN